MPLSGLYAGTMRSPEAQSERLELRVDVDDPLARLPRRVSGDRFCRSVPVDGEPAAFTFAESWIVDAATVRQLDADTTRIEGEVSLWSPPRPGGVIQVDIPTTAGAPAGDAIVTWTLDDGRVRTYSCAFVSEELRSLKVEIAVCRSVAPRPVAVHVTTSHPDRPDDLVHRPVTIESAFREAGVRVSLVTPAPGDEIDDAVQKKGGWSDDELLDAMKSHFADHRLEWPRWSVWGLFADVHQRGDDGVMFDVKGAVQRQGVAVFRDPRFTALSRPGPPDVEAMRFYLFTWVHEIGHTFNVLHSFDRNRRNALSWMNYPDRFGAGAQEFWRSFAFRFDDEELRHIRHGNRSAVIMGGDPYGSGAAHVPSRAACALRATTGGSGNDVIWPLDLSSRGNRAVDFMAPVTIELRLRNRTDDVLDVDARLTPQDGRVAIYIERPDGRATEYVPMTRRLRGAFQETLAPLGSSSVRVDLTYGRDGFYFSTPGDYAVRAIYSGAGTGIVLSNVLRIRVEHPASSDLDRLAQDFFTDDVGQCLYMEGSQSPHLARGLAVLQALAERYRLRPSGVELAVMLARGIATPFHRIVNNAVRRVKEADPAGALLFTEHARQVLGLTEHRRLNDLHHRLGRARADWRVLLGDVAAARTELTELYRSLGRRGVRQPVLHRLQSDIDALAKRGPAPLACGGR